MKRLTTLLSLVIVIAMIASMCVVGTSAAAGDVDTWDGTYDVSWYDPTKTQFTISTAEQLAGMGELSEMGITFEGCYFKLTTDIALNEGDAANWDLVAPANVWTKTIGNSSASFAGHFDGQGHTISGIYCPAPEAGQTGDEFKYRALFGSLGDVTEMNESSVRNLIITNSFIGGYINCAALAAKVVGLTKIEDVRVTKTRLYVPGDLYPEKSGTSNVNTGCIVGLVNGASELIINRCAAIDCDLFGWVRVGSIVGGGTGIYMEVNDCYSNSTVNAENRPGGIIGHSSISLVMVNNCVYTGDLICPATNNYGAIIGGFRADASAEIELQNCFYTGTYVYRGEPAIGRVGVTEIGVMTDGSTYYTTNTEDISGEPSSNDADGVEVEITKMGAGAFEEFAAKLDANVWDVANGTATLKAIAINETEFEEIAPTDTEPADTTPADTTPADTTPADTTPTDTKPADTTPTDTTPTDTEPTDTTPTDAPAEGGCGSFIGGGIVVATAILGTAWVSKKH